MQDWVQHVNEAREALLGTSTQNSAMATPIPIPASGSRNQQTISQSPGAISSRGAPTPSPPSARSVGFAGPVTSDSESEDEQVQSEPAKTPEASNSPAKPLAGTSMGKDLTKIILSGYLMKSRSKRKGWRKRYFVLTADALLYSASHMVWKFPFRL